MAESKSPADAKDDKEGDVDEGHHRKGSSIDSAKKHAVVKVGMLGDPAVGKTSLSNKYIEGEFKQDYIQTLGVLPQEKTVDLKNTSITFSVFDLGGDEQFLNMLPVVCNDAVALLFVFDLTRISTLANLRKWYTQARVLNKTAHALLVGTKFDVFNEMKDEDKDEISKQAIKVANAMKAPLIFCSSSIGINVQNIFKICISKVFHVPVKIKEITKIGDPLIIFESTAAGR